MILNLKPRSDLQYTRQQKLESKKKKNKENVNGYKMIIVAIVILK